jgi:twitching motility protein PilT
MANQVRRQFSLVLKAIVSMQLIERIDGKGRIPVVEILLNSPKIQKQIETSETKDILEEMENSVAYYKMQSMNQSLIALLVNGAIDLQRAMELTTDPEDLSLKLRKLFPSIEEKFRGGIMAPSVNDFSAITELMDIKKLYEEQDEKWKLRVQEKDEVIRGLEADLHERERLIDVRAQQASDSDGEVLRMRQENERLKQEAAARITQLNERIKELNQRLMGTTGSNPAAPSPPPSGFFKR